MNRRALLVIGLLLLVNSAAWLHWWHARREASQDRVILAAARKYGLDPALIKAVVWQESRFDPMARGQAGEIGLMQICSPAAQEWAKAEKIKRFAHTELYHPGKNTQAGTWYLRRLLRRYTATDNPLPYALADYNAGRGNVLKWTNGPAATNNSLFIAQIGFPSTKAYVLSVMERYAYYRPSFPPELWLPPTNRPPAATPLRPPSR